MLKTTLKIEWALGTFLFIRFIFARLTFRLVVIHFYLTQVTSQSLLQCGPVITS